MPASKPGPANDSRRWERSKYRWSGQVMESMDGLGFIGRNPGDAEHIDIAAGDSGMGETAEK